MGTTCTSSLDLNPFLKMIDFHFLIQVNILSRNIESYCFNNCNIRTSEGVHDHWTPRSHYSHFFSLHFAYALATCLLVPQFQCTVLNSDLGSAAG